MNLGDKIMTLRRKRGWSQEELAGFCQVSRQSVSKWESSQSMPDLDKILLLSKIFGVSTDFLLKEEHEREQVELGTESVLGQPCPQTQETQAAGEPYDEAYDEVVARRRVGKEETADFLEHEAGWSRRMASAVMMCILSPVPMILLGGMGECGVIPLNEDQGGIIGMILLFLILLWPVTTFIRYGMEERDYAFLAEGRFELAYGVDAMIRQQRKAYQPRFTQNITLGVVFCLVSVIPLFAAGYWEQEVLEVLATGFLLVLISLGVFLFVSAGIIWGSFDRLLKEGDYNPRTGDNSPAGKIGAVYWPLMAAIYLAWSFLSGDWHITWLVWPVAGCVFAAIAAACRMREKE